MTQEISIVGSTVSNEVAELAELAYQASLGSSSMRPTAARTAAMRAAIEMVWSQIVQDKLPVHGQVFHATLGMFPAEKQNMVYAEATQALIRLMHEERYKST